MIRGAASWDGAPARVFVSHRCVPGLIPARCRMWVEFVVGSLHLHCFTGFSPSSPDFLIPQKPAFLNSNSTRTEDPHKNHLCSFLSKYCNLFRIFFCCGNDREGNVIYSKLARDSTGCFNMLYTFFIVF